VGNCGGKVRITSTSKNPKVTIWWWNLRFLWEAIKDVCWCKKCFSPKLRR
jgi:hypothetical protein